MLITGGSTYCKEKKRLERLERKRKSYRNISDQCNDSRKRSFKCEVSKIATHPRNQRQKVKERKTKTIHTSLQKQGNAFLITRFTFSVIVTIKINLLEIR